MTLSYFSVCSFRIPGNRNRQGPPVTHLQTPKMATTIRGPGLILAPDQNPGQTSFPFRVKCIYIIVFETHHRRRVEWVSLHRSRSHRSSRRHYSRSRSRSHRRRSRSRSRSWRRHSRRSHSRSPMSNRRRHIGNRVCIQCFFRMYRLRLC